MSKGSTEAEIYAEFGLEVPSQQPEAAGPAGEGGKEQGVAGPDGADQATGYQATGNGQQATGGGGRIATAPAGPRNDSAGDGGTGDPGPTAENGDGPGKRIATAPAGPRNDSAGDGGAEAGNGGRSVSAPTAENDGGTGEPGPAEGTGTMSRAERAEQARLRRQREEQARVDAAVRKALEERDAAHKDEMAAIFSAAGMTDRYNGGKAITTKEEFDAWRARAQAEKLGRELKNGTLTPESFQQAVDASPAVQKAAALAAKLEAQEQARKAQADREAFDRQVEAELAEIAKLDPGVKSLEDALNLQTGEEFRRLVSERGMSFLEAFKLANMDRLAEARAQAAAQGAALRNGGKQHLRSVVASSGSVPAEVPRAVIEMYRDLCPEMTIEQIRQDYQKRYGG